MTTAGHLTGDGYSRLDVTVQELQHSCRDLVAVGFQGEVAGSEESHLLIISGVLKRRILGGYEMKGAGTQRDSTSEAPMVGDHLAMDLLNTEARSQGRVVDFWNTGEDVLQWLQRHGVAPVSARAGAPAGLLTHARTLRTQARELIAKRKEEKVGDIRGINL